MATQKTRSVNAMPVRRAMVLAAGLGKRMRPLTDHLPKPLVAVAGKTLLDHALDHLAEAGIPEAIVNVHYLADQIEAHLATRKKAPEITISDERAQLLETAGGIKKALPLLAPDGRTPFLTVNSDELWIEGSRPNIPYLLASWRPDDMDILLLLAAHSGSVGYQGRGDFLMDPLGRLTRRPEGEMAAFIYAGVAIVKPELFAAVPDGPVSMNLLFDRAIAAGRLYGVRLDGIWLHVGTVEAIGEAERRIAQSTR